MKIKTLEKSESLKKTYYLKDGTFDAVLTVLRYTNQMINDSNPFRITRIVGL